MSRGWESKSVEMQQDAKQESSTAKQPVQDETAPGLAAARAERARNVITDAEQKRRRQALELQRERVLSERTSSAHRRSALTNALASIEEELAQLGWTLHL